MKISEMFNYWSRPSEWKITRPSGNIIFFRGTKHEAFKLARICDGWRQIEHKKIGEKYWRMYCSPDHPDAS